MSNPLKTRATGLIVETDNDQQRMKILSLQKIGGIDVEVSLHGTLRTMKSVVVCRNLLDCKEAEIASDLTSQDVVACRSSTVRRDG